MSVQVHAYGEVVVLCTKTHRLAVGSRGGRILEYSVRGRNVISMAGDFVQQGSTFWVAPQSAWPEIWPPSIAIEDAPHNIRVLDSSLLIEAPPAVDLGIAMRRTIEMREDGSLHFEYAIDPLDQAVTWAPWQVTRLRPGLCFYALGDHREPILDDVNENIAPIVDEGLAWVPFRPGNDHFATLLGDAAGMCGYAHDGLLLIKRYDPVPASAFAPGNGSLKIWWQDSDFIELEPIGSFETLVPGQTRRWSVTWSLTALGDEVAIAPNSPSLRAAIG